MKISFTVNGTPRTIETDPWKNAREILAGFGFFNVRNGCDGEGTCGMCTILFNGKTVNSCLLSAAQLDGAAVQTVDFFNKNRILTAVQEGLVESGVVQCGYCTPAMVLALETLLSRNPEPDEAAIRDAFSGIYCRCTGYRQIRDAVRIAVAKLAQSTGPSTAPIDTEVRDPSIPRFRDDLRYIGKGSRKVDGARLARGERCFVEDMATPDTCHLRMLRSPYASAYIVDIDTAAAERLPGVVAVFSYKNTPETHYNQAGQGFPEPSPYDRRLFGRKMRHIGDRVAAVLAETPEIAARALSLVSVRYEPLEPVFSYEQATRKGAPLVHGGSFRMASEKPAQAPGDSTSAGTATAAADTGVTAGAGTGAGSSTPAGPGTPAGSDTPAGSREGEVIYQFSIHGDPSRNIAASVSGSIGDLEKGFSEADVVIERVYSTSQVHCSPVEPHVAFSRMDGDRIIVHASTQVPWHVRRIIAFILGISENRVRVIKERVGGGFGAKQDIVLEEVCAYATWVTGRPVIFRFNREEEFIAARTRHPMDIGVKLGAKKDGTMTAVQMTVRANTGPYGSHCLTVPMNACSKSLPLFLCPNVGFDVTTCYSNIPPAGAYQGYGAPQGSFALQTAVAELARELGIDQMEVVEKNRVREGSLLEILKCLGEGREGAAQTVSSCGLGPALKQGAELLEWGKKEESGDPDIAIGKGFSIIQQGSGLPGLDASNTDIKMLWDGTFLVKNGGADLGTGLDTVVVKVAAEVLKIPLSAVTILTGDTDTTPFDTGAYASSGTFFSGNATFKAAQKMKALIIETAGEMLGEPSAGLSIAMPGKVVGGSREITYGQVAAFTQGGAGTGELSVSAGFTTEEAAIPYGAHFCQVAVNRRTGKIAVQKYYALQDCGTPINPELCLGQIYSGVMKSLGHTLWEEMRLDENGTCVNANFTDYKIPMIGDIPADFRAILVETTDPHGPFGGKSVSEISMNGTAPAVAIAVHDAVGVWIRDWPITPEKVLRALGTIE